MSQRSRSVDDWSRAVNRSSRRTPQRSRSVGRSRAVNRRSRHTTQRSRSVGRSRAGPSAAGVAALTGPRPALVSSAGFPSRGRPPPRAQWSPYYRQTPEELARARATLDERSAMGLATGGPGDKGWWEARRRRRRRAPSRVSRRGTHPVFPLRVVVAPPRHHASGPSLWCCRGVSLGGPRSRSVSLFSISMDPSLSTRDERVCVRVCRRGLASRARSRKRRSATTATAFRSGGPNKRGGGRRRTQTKGARAPPFVDSTSSAGWWLARLRRSGGGPELSSRRPRARAGRSRRRSDSGGGGSRSVARHETTRSHPPSPPPRPRARARAPSAARPPPHSPYWQMGGDGGAERPPADWQPAADDAWFALAGQ